MGCGYPEVAKHHLVSTVLQKGVEVGGVVLRSGGRRKDVYVDEGQWGSSEVSLDCQNFRRVIIWEYAIVRHPIEDVVVDESDSYHRLWLGDRNWHWHSLWTPWKRISPRVWSLAHMRPAPGDGAGSPSVQRASEGCHCR